jgi:hypothetical protein
LGIARMTDGAVWARCDLGGESFSCSSGEIIVRAGRVQIIYELRHEDWEVTPHEDVYCPAHSLLRHTTSERPGIG